MRKFLLSTATLLVLAVSCKKDKDFSKAVVVDTGDVTSDGCGWVLRMEDGKIEKPEYMPSAFQHDNLKVKVKFHSTGVLDTCRSLAPHEFYEAVKIDDIVRDLD
jgi:hypothetical protein